MDASAEVGKSNTLAIDTRGDDLAAILILGDSMDWGVDMQVMTDALLNHQHCSSHESGSGSSHLPIFACNADIVYTGRHPNPRFTQGNTSHNKQLEVYMHFLVVFHIDILPSTAYILISIRTGAFVHAFKSLFEHYSDIPLDIEFCGKPYPIQYKYAEELFLKNAQVQGIPPPSQCFGIGDNPKSDIRGANHAGSHWRSVLVRTGVFQGKEGDNDPQDPADFVVQDVLEAVQLLVNLQQQLYNQDK